MSNCEHCGFKSNESYPNCPSCGLIKNMRDYNEMKTFQSGGFVFKGGEETRELLDCDKFSALRRKITGNAF